MSYKAIIFDNAGVVIDENHKRWSKKIAEHFHQPFEKIYKHYSRGKAWPLYRTGKISENIFWQIGNKEAGLNLDIEVLKKIVREIRTPYKEIVDLLYILHNQYLLALLNNEGKNWDQYSKNNESFYKLFSIAVSSYGVGVIKPAPEIYDVLVKKLQSNGIKPNECVYIDDRENNLTPAKKLGFITILYTSPKNLKDTLSKLGVI